MVYTFNLENRIVLITGGYSHLGEAAVESLLFHGASVYVLGMNKEKFLQTFAKYSSGKDKLFFQHCDISSTSSISKAFKSIYSKTNKIDVLINNAAYSEGRSPDKINDKEWSIGIDGVLSSVYRCIREIIPYFKKNRSGKIINVSSMYGIVSPDFRIYDNYPDFLNPPHYGAAKAGVIQLTKYYASYLGKGGIAVNAIVPGPFPSKDVQKNKGFIDELRKKTCLNRIGFPEDIAGAFVFLASDASNFMTGQNLIIDGGWTTR
jgi:NAD(P)-dependent dehydrogenase (short-subunit alcohol dehydrogenase family)